MCDEDDGMEATQEDVDQELEEELLVVVTNAVVDPGAVVVHAGDTSLADRAVMTAWGLDGYALLALFRQ